MDKLLSIIIMVGVLLLVLPGFLQSNSNLKQFFKNLSIWVVLIILILGIIICLNNKLVFDQIRFFNFY